MAREAFKLIRALAGNDTVKANILKDGAAKLLAASLNTHKSNETVARAALACIATLTLRSKDNSQLLFETDFAELIMEAMKIHSKSKIVQVYLIYFPSFSHQVSSVNNRFNLFTEKRSLGYSKYGVT